MQCLVLLPIILILLLGSAVISFAQVLIVQPDLPVGTQYRLVFITDGETDATSSDINTYNSFVTSQADSNPLLDALNTQWYVLGATSTVGVFANTGTDPANVGVPIYNLGGGVVASNYQSLWSGFLQTPIDYSQSLALDPNNGEAFTGIDANGTTIETLGGGSTVNFGDSYTTFPEWADADQFSNISTLSLYGISGVLTVEPAATTAVPEPSTWASLLVGFAALGLWQLRRGRQTGLRS